MRMLLLSEEPKDQEFFKLVSNEAKFPLQVVHTSQQLSAELKKNPLSMLIVDASNEVKYKEMELVLSEEIGLFNQILNPNNIIFIGDEDLYKCSWLASSDIFGTHIARSFTKENVGEFSRLLKAIAGYSYKKNSLSLNRFFATEAAIQKIKITKSKQKPAIIESFKNHLVELGFQMRTAAIIASATDEIIINAIYDAPVDATGKYVYITTPRNTEINMSDSEYVELAFGFDGHVLAVSALDHFGSLDKKKLLKHLSTSYESEELKLKTNIAGTGIGLANTYRNCSGIIFECEPGSITNVTIFFRKTESYKQFKDSFRYISCILNDTAE